MSSTGAAANRCAEAACRNCGAPVGEEHFCPRCSAIQPPRGQDHFRFLGLPRKLAIDAGDLEARFHQLSWRLHPDNFASAGEYERRLSLELSSQLNDAYRALSDPLRRAEYLLAQAGLRRAGQQKQQAPPELLEEVFELNESLEQLRAARRKGEAGELAELRSRLRHAREMFAAKLREVDQDLQRTFAEWDRGIDAGREMNDPAQRKLLERIGQALNRRSYLRNLAEGAERELGE